MAEGDSSTANKVAEAWHRALHAPGYRSMPFEADRPADPGATLAGFITRALHDGLELLVLVPDDAALAELSGALPIEIRPLCLLLPEADFASSTALRATLTLLASRLGRDGDDSRSPPWLAHRGRLQEKENLWRQARSWLATPPAAGSLPIEFAALFPVFVLPPARLGGSVPDQAGIILLYGCELPATLSGVDGRLLRIGRPAVAVPGGPDGNDETARLLIERVRLSQDLTDLELELASVQEDLGAFRQEYYRQVGALIATLDALRAADLRTRAANAPDDPDLRAAAARSEKEAAESAAEARQFETAPAEPMPMRTDDVRQLFRRLAQQIHPDRARDEKDRAWRTQLMSEANQAYRNGDLDTLREIATLWAEQSPAQREPSRPSPVLLAEQVARLRAKLDRVESELHRLFGSALYELFIAARQATRQGRDLLQEMAARLRNDIAAAGGVPPEPI